jgi:hypothetical protein
MIGNGRALFVRLAVQIVAGVWSVRPPWCLRSPDQISPVHCCQPSRPWCSGDGQPSIERAATACVSGENNRACWFPHDALSNVTAAPLKLRAVMCRGPRRLLTRQNPAPVLPSPCATDSLTCPALLSATHSPLPCPACRPCAVKPPRSPACRPVPPLPAPAEHEHALVPGAAVVLRNTYLTRADDGRTYMMVDRVSPPPHPAERHRWPQWP